MDCKINKIAAFTMAEILITLGVLGIVIAMTLPTVVRKYKRKTAETKLAKFYTIMNQAVKMSISEHGEILIDNTNKTSVSNSAYIEKWYKENITKYIKTIYEEGADKNGTYYKVSFIDGTGFSSYMSASNQTTGKSSLFIFYCLNYKNCRHGQFDGKNQFLFIYNPEKQSIIPHNQGQSYRNLKNNCYSSINRHSCAALIEANNWKIPDDYPWIK